jgi:hypothetical protein
MRAAQQRRYEAACSKRWFRNDRCEKDEPSNPTGVRAEQGQPCGGSPEPAGHIAETGLVVKQGRPGDALDD